MKPGSGEVMVESEDGTNAMPLHQTEGKAVREGNALVGELPHEAERILPVVRLRLEDGYPAGEEIRPPTGGKGVVGAPGQKGGGFIDTMFGGMEDFRRVGQPLPRLRRLGVVLVPLDLLGQEGTRVDTCTRHLLADRSGDACNAAPFAA